MYPARPMNAKTSEATISRLHDRVDQLDEKMFQMEMLVGSLKQSNDLMHRLVLVLQAPVAPSPAPLTLADAGQHHSTHLPAPVVVSGALYGNGTSHVPFQPLGTGAIGQIRGGTPQPGGHRHRWASTL